MSTGVKRAMSDQENQQLEAAPSAERQSVDRGHRDRGRRRHRQPPRHQEASINMNELRELIGLITDNGLTDFELEREGFHVKIGRNLHPERSEEHTSELQSQSNLVCRLLLEKKK